MNKKFLPALLMVFLASVAFFSCKKSSSNNAGDKTWAYFPLQLGKFVVYNVDSTLYDSASCTKTVRSSQIRYSISDTMRDEQNRFSYLMNVDTRSSDADIWHQQGVVYLTNNGSQLEYTQKNLRFIKLVFPIVEGTKWNGNQFIPVNDTPYQYYKGWAYTYQDYGKPFNNGLVNFDNTVTVLESDDMIANTAPSSDSIAFTYRSYAKEVYAYNVGMVYREVTHLNFDSSISKCMGGTSVIYRAVDHN